MLYTLFRLIQPREKTTSSSGCCTLRYKDTTYNASECSYRPIHRQLQVYLVDQKANKQAALVQIKEGAKRLTTGGYALSDRWLVQCGCSVWLLSVACPKQQPALMASRRAEECNRYLASGGQFGGRRRVQEVSVFNVACWFLLVCVLLVCQTCNYMCTLPGGSAHRTRSNTSSAVWTSRGFFGCCFF